MQTIKIGNKLIGENQPCFIIAEAGCNHNGNLNLAKKLINAAVDSKADAVKFQTFIAEKETTLNAPKAKYAKNFTDPNESQYEMLKNMELSNKEHYKLKEYADKRNIIFFSTPYEVECVDLLMKLKVPAMKISSGELNNPFLVKKIAKTKIPIILSTGMATMAEIRNCVNLIKKYNNKLILLHCTSSYPTPIGDVNMRAMLTLKQKFGLEVGYSDHTEGILVPIVAVSLGAKVIEKHITLDKNLPGPDHKASLEPNELKEMVLRIRETEKVLGSPIKRVLDIEKDTRKVVRRSIVALRDISKGEIINLSMITFKKPGTGIPPVDTHKIIGKKAEKNIKKDKLLKLEDLK